MSPEIHNVPQEMVDPNRDRLKKLAELGVEADKQINEIYAKRYESNAQHHRAEMVKLENQLTSAKDEAERQQILSQIEDAREQAEHFESEARSRRGYIQETEH